MHPTMHHHIISFPLMCNHYSIFYHFQTYQTREIQIKYIPFIIVEKSLMN